MGGLIFGQPLGESQGPLLTIPADWTPRNTKYYFAFSVYSGEVSANLSLANYIRDRAGLTGTKIMCAQVDPSFQL
jgi:hypothetical protein